MGNRPYIVYPDKDKVKTKHVGQVVRRDYIDEPGQVSCGMNEFVSGAFRPLHHHHVWEISIIDRSSEGPAYILLDGQWWRADPGSVVFIPEGYPHAWSTGSSKGFRVMWFLGGSVAEGSRVLDTDPETFQPITPEEEQSTSTWTAEAK